MARTLPDRCPSKHLVSLALACATHDMSRDNWPRPQPRTLQPP